MKAFLDLIDNMTNFFDISDLCHFAVDEELVKFFSSYFYLQTPNISKLPNGLYTWELIPITEENSQKESYQIALKRLNFKPYEAWQVEFDLFSRFCFEIFHKIYKELVYEKIYVNPKYLEHIMKFFADGNLFLSFFEDRWLILLTGLSVKRESLMLKDIKNETFAILVGASLEEKNIESKKIEKAVKNSIELAKKNKGLFEEEAINWASLYYYDIAKSLYDDLIYVFISEVSPDAQKFQNFIADELQKQGINCNVITEW